MRQIEASLGIDIGTGSTKAGLVDAAGRLLAVGRAGHPVRSRQPGWAETDPSDWKASVHRAVAEVLAARPDARPVVAGMSGQMHGVVVCNEQGEPLRPAVLWSDLRAAPYLDGLRSALEARGAHLANPVVSGMAGPTLAALRSEEPQILDRAAAVLQPKDWVRHSLTGYSATDPSDASATLLWDVAADDWSLVACDAFDVDPGLLPSVLPSAAQNGSTVAGPGIPEGIPVAVGAADVAAALLGAGVQPGETQVSIGSGGQIAQLSAAASRDPTLRTHLFRAAAPGYWYAMAAMQNVGNAFDWALATFGVESGDLGWIVAASSPGAAGATFVPFLSGERTPYLDPDLRGGLYGLHSRLTRADIIRSIFEGVAFALRDGLDALRDAGREVTQALLAGGGSTAAWWRQMLADVLEMPLVPHDAADASVRGAAILGWAALGVDVDAKVARHGPIEPRTDYSAGRARYLEAVATLTR